MGKGRVVVLGGCGAMASSCVYDLDKASGFGEILIADTNQENARKLMDITSDRVSFVEVDVHDREKVVKLVKDADYVVNGMSFHLEEPFLEAIKEAGGVTAVDLNADETVLGHSKDLASRDCSLYYLNGGLVITSLLGIMGCEEMDQVDDVNFYWGMWRPITHVTHGLAWTALHEHDPSKKDRVIWEDGQIIRDFPPFALGKDWVFPDPIGVQETYIIPHTESITFPLHPIAKEKKVKRVTVRGVFHHGWVRYAKTLLETGIFEAEPIQVNGVKVSPLDVCQATLIRESKEQWEDPHKLARQIGWEPQVILSAEIIGYKDGRGHRVVYHCQSPYPFFEGNPVTPSMEYGCYVGVPCSITLQMMANNEFPFEKGVFATETCGITPPQFFEKLEERGFRITRSVKGVSDERA